MRIKVPRRKAMLLLVAGWLLAVSAWALYYVTSMLSGPPDSDLYANTFGFQLLVFVLFRLPIALLLLAAGVAVVIRLSDPAHGENAG